MTLCLIDADILCYRNASATEHEELWVATSRLDVSIQNCLEDCNASEYLLFLSGDPGTNFRYRLYPEYKSNRKTPKPKHLEHLREYLVKRWDAIVTDGYEADDAIGISSTDYPDGIICSIDKDLLQLPGKHWNFVKKEFCEITESEGLKRLYTQVLVGDNSDNIQGAKGIGKVKAERILQGIHKESEYIEACRPYFGSLDEFMITAQLVYVLRKEGRTWTDRPAAQNWISQNRSEQERAQR